MTFKPSSTAYVFVLTFNETGNTKHYDSVFMVHLVKKGKPKTQTFIWQHTEQVIVLSLK
jgi:hypothetical protein